MTKKLAVVENTDLTKLEGFTTIDEMKKWASTILDSGLLPFSIDTPEQVITIVQHGKELGLTPHIALNNIHIISGRPTLSSTILGSLLKRRGIEWIWDKDFEIIEKDGIVEMAPDKSPNRMTTIHFFWKSNITDRVMETTHSVTWAQMYIAGYTTKENYKKYPKEMLRSRALSYGVRALFPEVLSGFYTDLEIQDAVPAEDISVKLNDEGDIILTSKKD